MNKNIGVALGLALLLSACGSTNSTVASSPTGVTGNEIPDVPRLVNTGAYICPTSSAPLSRILGSGQMLDQGNHIRLLQAQTTLPDTLQDLLYSTKSIINNMYFGYSDVAANESTLNDVHNSAYYGFKFFFPNKLASYNLYALGETQQSQVDNLMSTYIKKMNDGHTFYMNRTSTYNDKNGASPVPVYGVSRAVIPGQDGFILTDVRLNGPAWKVGLRRGDVILSVNGTALTRTAGTSDDDLTATFTKVMSTAAADAKPVTLVVATTGVKRSVVVTPAILKGTSMPWGEVRNDASGKQHYYLRIPTFMSVSPERNSKEPLPIADKVHALVAEAQSKGIDNIVIDLRGDGGGLLIEFVGAAAAFAPQTAGESTHYSDGGSYSFSYKDGVVLTGDTCGYTENFNVINPAHWTGKVTVLVDGDSASASEMFSTNMQAAGIKVIGTDTYGIGSTSTYHMDLPGDRSMSITAGRTFVGDKRVADHITPDIKSADDLVQLANTGVDNTLQVAYDTMK